MSHILNSTGNKNPALEWLAGRAGCENSGVIMHCEDGCLQVNTIIPSVVDDILARIENGCDYDRLFKVIRSDSAGRWQAIRDLYKQVDVDEYDPYIVDWVQIFSPIESMAWGEIRYYGLPFWPQYPIGRFFADFACPQKKLVIECDGKDFHDAEKDRARDHEMALDGWSVFRISGADCNRVIAPPWEEIADKDIDPDSAEARNITHYWMHKTIDGLIACIANVFFNIGVSGGFFADESGSVLSARSKGAI